MHWMIFYKYFLLSHYFTSHKFKIPKTLDNSNKNKTRKQIEENDLLLLTIHEGQLSENDIR